MKLVKHKTYSGMFYVQWPDGTLSVDFYNKTRANNFRKVLEENGRRDSYRIAVQSPLEARGCV